LARDAIPRNGITHKHLAGWAGQRKSLKYVALDGISSNRAVRITPVLGKKMGPEGSGGGSRGGDDGGGRDRGGETGCDNDMRHLTAVLIVIRMAFDGSSPADDD
jgi:hypothetical protein